ncbi:hypothetical protein [Limnoglobus roseus]|uniref:Uncharacterized protein n=1 Tax=Limnoglobus roseus TaxID=2598579 RepID=A0A5C1A5V8_9BACT|nr:hypothetical protein [Limnoglobus roseus]QEL13366.1 hypothetical protein PX52LOC_00220 [Limnoglobus roseus]
MSDKQSSPPEAEIVLTPPSALDDRLKRLEESIAGMRSQALAPANEDDLAERVLKVLTAKAAEHRAANGVGPAGLAPLASMPVVVPPEIGSPPNGQSLWGWFVAGIVSEITIIARMYFDPRYRLSRVAQFGVPAILGLFVLNYFFFAYTCALPIVPLIGERLVCVILSLALYKVLVREVSRYRQVLEYLARFG